MYSPFLSYFALYPVCNPSPRPVFFQERLFGSSKVNAELVQEIFERYQARKGWDGQAEAWVCLLISRKWIKTQGTLLGMKPTSYCNSSVFLDVHQGSGDLTHRHKKRCLGRFLAFVR